MAISVGVSDLYNDTRALALRKLSSASAAFVNTMVVQAEDARALWQSANDKQSKLLARLQEVEVRHEHIQRQVEHGYNRVETLIDGNMISAIVKLPKNDPTVVAVRKELADAQSEFEKQTAIAAERGATVRSCDQLLQSIARYLDAVDTKLSDAPKPPSRKVDVSVAALEAARSEIGSLKAAVAENEAAPVTTAQRKREAAEMIRALADRGIPKLFDLAAGTLPFEFGTVSIRHSALGGVPGTRDVISTQGSVDVPDALATLCWLFPEQMQAAIEQEIDAAGDDAAAVDDETRAKRDADLKQQVLAAEREEEALVRGALSAGMAVLRRPNADVRAVLGITGPPPPV